MAHNMQDDILRLHALGVLDLLLTDRTTKSRVTWATDAYAPLGPRYARSRAITPRLITGSNTPVIQTRAAKERDQRSSRTRHYGEVSTPFKICKRMCDYAHGLWPDPANWRKYVDAKVLEITCGEAPFLVSRYDAQTGRAIPVSRRAGLLDRKLQMVNEHAGTEKTWLVWALRAFQASYGYEFQGDNLLIARLNLLMTFEEYLFDRWKRLPTPAEYRRFASVITWNIWQMDGLTGTVAHGKELLPCRVMDWPSGKSVPFSALPAAWEEPEAGFWLAVGNPPYQDQTLGENKGFAPPIYHKFLDSTYPLADVVVLIHPARFLFHAGSTPKAWNQKMLADPHLKVLYYESDTSKVFPNTDIKGGVAITCRDAGRNFGAIETFTAYPELASLLKKVLRHRQFSSFSDIVVTRTAYRLTDKLHQDHPHAIRQLSDGHTYDMSTNIFQRLPQVFFDTPPQDGETYIQILGRAGNDRVYQYIRACYVNQPPNLYAYKIYLPKANATGLLGETLASPVLAGPGIGATETFLSVGAFATAAEAEAALKYIKTKFVRALLGILKTTQDLTPQKWAYVPLQDFTSISDIDWSDPIPALDRQLYSKYALSQREIRFIEGHVKEMT